MALTDRLECPGGGHRNVRARPADDDGGGLRLGNESVEGELVAPDGQLTQASDLPGVDDGVVQGATVNADREDARFPSRWVGFEHRDGVTTRRPLAATTGADEPLR